MIPLSLPLCTPLPNYNNREAFSHTNSQLLRGPSCVQAPTLEWNLREYGCVVDSVPFMLIKGFKTSFYVVIVRKFPSLPTDLTEHSFLFYWTHSAFIENALMKATLVLTPILPLYVLIIFTDFNFPTFQPPKILPRLVSRSPMFSSQKFMVLSLMIKSYFELVFCVWCKMVVQFH